LLLLCTLLALCEASSSSAACINVGTPISLPVTLPVIDQFRAPSCIWCSGNRGIEYHTIAGSTVSAAANGIATFVGLVAGTRYVVIRTSDNLLVTHGRLQSVSVKAGASVVVGQAIGVAGESLYIGVRINGQYTDPRQCAGLGSLGKPRAVLVAG
jgi:murein DD-endopeptidase MepM/ murein hydrolase activator NlpD